MVWTQNDGHLLGYTAGPVHTDVWNWWVAIHHNIGISSAGQVTIAASAAQKTRTYHQSQSSLTAIFRPLTLMTINLIFLCLARVFDKGLPLNSFRLDTNPFPTPRRHWPSVFPPLSGGDLAAEVTFTSHQDPADSPGGEACTNWNITLYLSKSGSGYLIDAPPPGYHATYSAMPAMTASRILTSGVSVVWRVEGCQREGSESFITVNLATLPDR